MVPGLLRASVSQQIRTGQESEGQKGDLKARDDHFQMMSLKPKHIREEMPSPSHPQGRVAAGIDMVHSSLHDVLWLSKHSRVSGCGVEKLPHPVPREAPPLSNDHHSNSKERAETCPRQPDHQIH